MEGSLFWIAALVVLIVVAVGMFSLGTLASVSTGRYCEVDTHWYFGWWVRAKAANAVRAASAPCNGAERAAKTTGRMPAWCPKAASSGAARWSTAVSAPIDARRK